MRFSCGSALIGALSIAIPLRYYMNNVCRIEDKEIESKGTVVVVHDSLSSKTDTVMLVPLKASELFNSNVNDVIQKKRIKIVDIKKSDLKKVLGPGEY